MKIQAVSIWKDGKIYKASEFEMRSVSDDLKSCATFHFEMKEKSSIVNDNEVQGQVLAVGNLQLMGEEYTSWDGSNNSAYLWALNQLNIKAATL